MGIFRCVHRKLNIPSSSNSNSNNNSSNSNNNSSNSNNNNSNNSSNNNNIGGVCANYRFLRVSTHLFMFGLFDHQRKKTKRFFAVNLNFWGSPIFFGPTEKVFIPRADFMTKK